MTDSGLGQALAFVSDIVYSRTCCVGGNLFFGVRFREVGAAARKGSYILRYRRTVQILLLSLFFDSQLCAMLYLGCYPLYPTVPRYCDNVEQANHSQLPQCITATCAKVHLNEIREIAIIRLFFSIWVPWYCKRRNPGPTSTFSIRLVHIRQCQERSSTTAVPL